MLIITGSSNMFNVILNICESYCLDLPKVFVVCWGYAESKALLIACIAAATSSLTTTALSIVATIDANIDDFIS